MTRKRVKLLISGRVQGVFYRHSARTEALRLGLDGTVRNLADGRVEAEAEGEPEALESFLEWCRQGPPGARVDGVDVTWAENANEFSGFRVLR